MLFVTVSLLLFPIKPQFITSITISGLLILILWKAAGDSEMLLYTAGLNSLTYWHDLLFLLSKHT